MDGNTLRFPSTIPYAKSINYEAMKKSGWIDFNAGVVADGTSTLDDAAKGLMALVLEVASGKQTKTEEKGFRNMKFCIGCNPFM